MAYPENGKNIIVIGYIKIKREKKSFLVSNIYENDPMSHEMKYMNFSIKERKKKDKQVNDDDFIHIFSKLL